MSQDDNIDYDALRLEMVEVIAIHAKLTSAQIGKNRLAGRVMSAMAEVPRHEFVPEPLQRFAYINSPLPIGYGKTISQPFIVALMTDLLQLDPSDLVLEVGTGLGYQSAVLAKLARHIHTVEIISELADAAHRKLDELGYRNIDFRIGDGSHGWLEHSPYDKIIVTAAPEMIPVALIRQLKRGGRMVIPVGSEGDQKLMLVTKDAHDRTETREILEVSFAPLVLSH